MTTTYTVDLFSSLDGFGSAVGDWTAYWGKQGPELLAERSRILVEDQAIVLGANTYRVMSHIVDEEEDPTFDRLNEIPKIVISTTLEPPLAWTNSTLISEDALDAILRLKETSPIPLRSLGSLAMNRALLAAGLVDRLEVTIFPVITGASGREPLFATLPDLDLELVDSRLFDGRIQQLTYVPSLHA